MTQKTLPTKASVDAYIKAIDDEGRRKDCKQLVTMLQSITGEKPVMWGTAIIGFGKVHYKYASGHEGDTCIAGLANRKAAITLYCYPGLEEQRKLLEKLGKHKTGKGCLYIKSLADIDVKVLEQVLRHSSEKMKTFGQ